MFVDKARIFVKPGNGGNGAVAFRREVYVPAGGPAGGDGGNGGSIIIKADNSLRTLMDLKYKLKYSAEPGDDGKGSNMHGKDGAPLVIAVPPGTIVRDEKSGLVIGDLKHDGDSVIVARGGRGGKGNTHFKTATRQAPSFAKAGTFGEERFVVLELKLLADVGLVGFPNVGKSTFLSIVTKAKPKIANYHFTTLTPNLGVVQTKFGDSFVMADIPGLIEGAHEGTGLGHDFLRHVERTKVLIHIVDVSGMEGRDPIDDFEKINSELEKYNPLLAKRPQIVVANKMDLPEAEDNYEVFKTEIESKGYKVFSMSAATRKGVDEVVAYAAKLLKEVEEVEVVSKDEIISNLESLYQNDAGIEIRIEDGAYVIESKALDNLLYSVNFEDMESIRYFQAVLEKKGVFEKLKAMGIKDGDLVKIYELEFEYYE